MKEKHITIGSIRTRYWISEAQGKPTMVLLHEGGYGGDAINTFGFLAPYLIEHYQLVMPDMLGYGQTDKAFFFGEDPYSPRLRHLEALYEALELEEGHFVGNSFGGGMALYSAVYGPTRRRVRSAISISGTGGPYRRPEGLAALANYEPTVENARLLDSLVIHDAATHEDHAQQRYESSLIPGQWEALMALRKLKSPVTNVVSELPGMSPEVFSQVEVPVLLVAGQQDPLLDAGWESNMAKHIERCQTLRINASHAPQIDKPREVAEIINKFINGIE